MTAPQANSSRPSVLRRYGPIIAIVVVIAIVGAVVALTRGSDDETASTGDGNRNPGDVAGLPLIYSQAEEEGRADSIDWGPNCNTDLGQVKIPSVYAPSCVEPYDPADGNGGATSPGVTADTINVVFYMTNPKLDPQLAAAVAATGADVDPDTAFETAQGFATIYEQVFELWGRKINLVRYLGTGAGTDAIAAKADAKAIIDMEPFAVLGGPSQTSAFRDELAAANVMCLGDCAGAVPQPQSDDIGGGLLFWPYAPSPEQASLLTAAMMCSQFNGGKAEYGGDDVKDTERVYGIAHFDTPNGDQATTFAVLRDSLEDCGIEIATDVVFNLDLARGQEIARTTIAKLMDAGVTSVIYLGDPINPTTMTTEATAQQWFPEWIIGPNVFVDISVFARTFDQEQWRHAFGIGLPATPVAQQAQSSFGLYEWGVGEEPPNNTYGLISLNVGLAYQAVMLAGPNLTPETVRGGLYAEPVRGGGPTTARMSRGEHGLWPFLDNYGLDDATLLWWNPDAVGEDHIGNEGVGQYEYVDNGKRYTLDGWPTRKLALFDKSSSITIFEELPKIDQPPDYPPLER